MKILGYTSKYAQDQMDKSVNGDKPKRFAEKSSKSKSISSLNRMTQGGKKKLDKGYIDAEAKKRAKQKRDMTPNDPRY